MQVLHFMLGEKTKGTHSSKILKEILAIIMKMGVYYTNITYQKLVLLHLNIHKTFLVCNITAIFEDRVHFLVVLSLLLLFYGCSLCTTRL